MDVSFHLGKDGIYRCQAFQQFIWQSHGFGTRHASPAANITLQQVHSDIVWNAHGLADREQEGDALITNEASLSVGVRTADCVPLLLLDSNKRAVAAVHAGWRGSAAELVRCTIHKMTREFGSLPGDVYAAVGPCIRSCCYEVGDEVAERFEKTFPEWRQTPPKPNGKRSLDLAQANIRQMQAAGVPSHQIFDSCTCTCCQIETFFSYRREPGEPGRMTSSISRLS